MAQETQSFIKVKINSAVEKTNEVEYTISFSLALKNTPKGWSNGT